MNELVPEGVFRFLITLATGGFSALWVVHDILFLARLRGKDTRDPLIRDQRFGYVMGIVMGLIGVVGALRYNGVV
ncbi:MAG TPA: hypothetical protein VFP84_01805 [Kofleriaceae bacterium]|nr:hypothetical protein [Kofleriaceae bacterium]